MDMLLCWSALSFLSDWLDDSAYGVCDSLAPVMSSEFIVQFYREGFHPANVLNQRRHYLKEDIV